MKTFLYLLIATLVIANFTSCNENPLSKLSNKVDTLEKDLEEQKTKAESDKESIIKSISEAKAQIAEADEKLKTAKAELDAGKIDKATFEQTKSQLERSKELANAKLSVARKQLNDIQDQLDELARHSIRLLEDGTYAVIYKNGVFEIGSRLFSSYKSPAKGERGLISQIVLSEDIVRIGSYAFMYNQISSVFIPKAVRYIERNAFENIKATKLEFEDGSGLSVIEPAAFAGNMFSEISLPEGLVFIGRQAFAYNRNLREFTIPKSVTVLGGSAITFPELILETSVTKVTMTKELYRDLMTKYVESHPDVTMNDIMGVFLNTVDYYTHEGELMGTITPPNPRNKRSALSPRVQIDHEDAEIITLADGSVSIITRPDLVKVKGWAFIGYRAKEKGDFGKITELILNEGLQSIGRSGFNNNRILSVTIPESVVTVERNAFEGNKMEKLVLNEGLESVKAGAFNNNKLKEVIIPESVKELKGSSFSNNPLERIVITKELFKWVKDSKYEHPDTNPAYHRGLEGIFGTGYDQWSRKLPSGLEIVTHEGVNLLEDFLQDKDYSAILDEDGMVRLTYHSRTKRIADWEFHGSFEYESRGKILKIKEVSLNEGLEVIGRHSFLNHMIPSVEIPQSVYEIGRNAFERTKVEKLTLNEGLQTIGIAAFHSNELKEVTIPKSVSYIGNSSFSKNPLIMVVLSRELFDSLISEDRLDRVFGEHKNIVFQTHSGKPLKTRSQWITHIKNALSWANDPKYSEISDKMKRVVISTALEGYEEKVTLDAQTDEEQVLFDSVIQWLGKLEN